MSEVPLQGFEFGVDRGALGDGRAHVAQSSECVLAAESVSRQNAQSASVSGKQ